MKKLMTVLAVSSILLVGMTAMAQTSNSVQPIVTSTNNLATDIKEIATFLTNGGTNWYICGYGMYAKDLQKQYGGGIAAMYPINKYLLTGLRCDFVDGGFWMPSGTVGLQLPVTPFSSMPWFQVTPIIYAGVGLPVSGAKLGSVTVPGSIKDNNGQATAITGVGGAILLYAPKGGNWSMELVGDIEQWSGFPGSQIRLGPAVHIKF